MATASFRRSLRQIRIVLYCFLALWSLLLFVFTIVRLVYTTTPRSERSLFNGQSFYDPSVVELTVCSLLSAPFSGLMLTILLQKRKFGILSRNWFELLGLFLLWLLWIGGAGSSTSVWFNLSFCIQFQPCVILQVMLAWAWLGWITIMLLLLPELYLVTRYRTWRGHLYEVSNSTNSSPSLKEPPWSDVGVEDVGGRDTRNDFRLRDREGPLGGPLPNSGRDINSTLPRLPSNTSSGITPVPNTTIASRPQPPRTISKPLGTGIGKTRLGSWLGFMNNGGANPLGIARTRTPPRSMYQVNPISYPDVKRQFPDSGTALSNSIPLPPSTEPGVTPVQALKPIRWSTPKGSSLGLTFGSPRF